MRISECCKAELKVKFGIECFHGSDDGYDLKVPYLVCTKCGKEYPPAFNFVANKGKKVAKL